MTIRDRGIQKWAPARFMPEGFAMIGEMYRDQERQAMPLLDEYQIEEFDRKVCYAMEYHIPARFSVWEDGFVLEIVGQVHRRDEITRELRIKLADGTFDCVKAGELVDVEVVED
ncbi:YolD-like family protein [Neobacillus niacini]|uniref:YolD-like family protein n=1 Tax=Neobacillus niacini TaxID=86668 RepID=UPI003000B99D